MPRRPGRIRRLALIAAVVFAVWLVILVILGMILGGRYRSGVADRLGESLHGDSSIDDADLALVRGRLALDGLQVRRDDLVGKLSLDVGHVECDLAPLGIALVDRDCRELAIRDMRLEVSSGALFKLKRPKRTPMQADSVVIENATLVFAPSALTPGIGQVQITIERAIAGPTTFKTPLSFLLSLQSLRASFDLPGGVAIKLAYEGGILTAAGSLFGSEPVALPIALPVADVADDAQAELKKIGKLGRDLAEKLVTQKAQDWLKTLTQPR